MPACRRPRGGAAACAAVDASVAIDDCSTGDVPEPITTFVDPTKLPAIAVTVVEPLSEFVIRFTFVVADVPATPPSVFDDEGAIVALLDEVKETVVPSGTGNPFASVTLAVTAEAEDVATVAGALTTIPVLEATVFEQ